MLKNKIIVKKIRNIFILLMAIIIMLGAYQNIRNSKAENVIQIEMEVSDKSNILSAQTITVDATETSDGNYLLTLPTSVNKNIVTKYYTSSGEEILVDADNNISTIQLTEEEVANKKVQVQSDYDTKEVTVNNQTKLLYNKELQELPNESGTGSQDVIVTGYMPLDVDIEVKEMDLATLTSVKLPSENQTMQKAYEISIFEVVEKQGTETNTTNEVQTQTMENGAQNTDSTQQDVATQVDVEPQSEVAEQTTENTETERVEYDSSVYGEKITVKTKQEQTNAIKTYTLAGDNQVTEVANITSGEYVDFESDKGDKTLKYIIATEENENEAEENISLMSEDTNSDIAVYASSSSSTLKSASSETSASSAFLGSTNIQRQNIESVTFNSTTTDATMPKGLIRNFDGGSYSGTTWTDLTKNKNGVVKGGSFGSDGNGNYLSLNGTSSQWVNLGRMEMFLKEQVTLDVIIKVSDITQTSVILGNVDDGGMEIALNAGKPRFSIWFENDTSYTRIDASSTIVANKSTRITGTYNGTTMALYVDGVQVGTKTKQNGIIHSPLNDTVMAIGCNPIGSSSQQNYFKGKIYSVKMYNKGLTGGEIAKGWNSSEQGVLCGLIRAMDGNYNTKRTGHKTNATTWYDLTGNQNGAIMNGTSSHTASTVSGKWGTNYLEFNGSTDWVNLGQIDTSITNKITLDAIVEVSDNTKTYGILSNIDDGGAEICLSKGFPKINLWFEGDTEYTRITAPKKIKKNTPTRITGIYNGKILALYVNGELAGSVTRKNATIHKPVNNTVMAIGCNPTGSSAQNYYFKGKVYSAKIYNKGLSQSQIQQIWDVSAAGDNSILAWRTQTGPYKVNIGSYNNIYANSDSSYLFSYIGYGSTCTETSVINGLELLNTSSATNMEGMFQYCGYRKMTGLSLGSNFYTSNVTNMSNMFSGCGQTQLTSFNLGSNFNTSRVTNMSGMFQNFAYNLGSLNLGTQFYTSAVTNMSNMFNGCGKTELTTFSLGSNFNTSKVTNMSGMFQDFAPKLVSLNLGTQFYTSAVTDMSNMFYNCGTTAMTSLDLGPAFTAIASSYADFATNCGKSGSITIYSGSAIYSNSNAFRLGANSSVTIGFSRGTINPKYKPEWSIQSYSVSGSSLVVTLQGNVNTANYTGDSIKTVTNRFTNGSTNSVRAKVDGNSSANSTITKTISNANSTAAQTVTCTLTLSNFAESVRQSGKNFLEWSGNVSLDFIPTTIEDVYGNPNLLQEDGTTIFTDVIKPEFTYEYTNTTIDHGTKTVTIVFDVADKYFSSSALSTDSSASNIDVVVGGVTATNATKTLTKIEDLSTTINGTSKKTGERYRLVITNLDQGEGNDYSGIMTLAFPADIVTDTSSNGNVAKTITVGIDAPTNGDGHDSGIIVDVVDPVWKIENINIDKTGKKVTADLIATDKYLTGVENSTLTTNDITVSVDDDVNANTVITKSLTEPTFSTNETTGMKEIKYTLTLDNFEQATKQTGKSFLEYSGTVKITVAAGTVRDDASAIAGTRTDGHSNTNKEKTFELGHVDFIKPRIEKQSATKDETAKTETIIINVIDKYIDTTKEITADEITIYADEEIVTGITKTFSKNTRTTPATEEDLRYETNGNITTTINGTSKVIGQQYKLVLSDFEQATNNSKKYKDWSGTISIDVAEGAAKDQISGTTANTNELTTLKGDFVDFITPYLTYQYLTTDIDRTGADADGKSFQMAFEVTDKYYESGKLSIDDLSIQMADGKHTYDLKNTPVTIALNSDEAITAPNVKMTNKTTGEVETVTSTTIGHRYVLTISNLEQLEIAEGNTTLDYSGIVTVSVDANKISDRAGNTNIAKTITSGVSIPDETGDGVVVDVVKPIWRRTTGGSLDLTTKTASLVVKGTDTYYASNSLTAGKIKVYAYTGTTPTDITSLVSPALSTATRLDESVTVDGVTSTRQYGVQYTITLTGIPIDKDQVKVVIPAGTLTDQSGNTNDVYEIKLFTTLKSTASESGQTSAFLGNSSIQRQNIESVTFLTSASGAANNKWDVSAAQDGSIWAWYTGSGPYQVYIGSDEFMCANQNSRYLFSYIGYASSCTAENVINGLEYLNTVTATDMLGMFFLCGFGNMTTLDLGNNFDTSNVTDMTQMFLQCGGRSMTDLNLGNKFDTSKVTSMYQMFYGCSGVTSLNLGNKFDTSNVTNMQGMFAECEKITSLTLGENFNTSNVTNMVEMFNGCGRSSTMTSLDLRDKFDTSNVTNMEGMFAQCGADTMTSLNLGDKFDTSSVTNMKDMFYGNIAMTNLDLGDKFDTSNVTNMNRMFWNCESMTTLDLGPKFTKIASNHTNFMTYFGTTGAVIYAPEAIYKDRTSFKLNSGDTSTASGAIPVDAGRTINPIYKPEWEKASSSLDTTTNPENPTISVVVKGSANKSETINGVNINYNSQVTSGLTKDNISVYIDGELDGDTNKNGKIDAGETPSITKTVTSASPSATSAEVTHTITLSGLEEALRQNGKSFKEWSGNIAIKIGGRGEATDTYTANVLTDEYGNQSMMETDASGTWIDVLYKDTDTDHNVNGTMFADFVKPEFTYEYSNTTINHETKTVTIVFDVTDKYFNSSALLTDTTSSNIDVVVGGTTPTNATKALTKLQDLTATVNGTSKKVGERYQLVITNLDQGGGNDYSGIMTLAFPADIITDMSTNGNLAKTITIGIDDPTTGDGDDTGVIVDVVDPIWKVENINIDKTNKKVTADLIATDKYLTGVENSTLTTNDITVSVDDDVNANTVITKSLTEPTFSTNETTGMKEIKYTLTLDNFEQATKQTGKSFLEYSGTVKITVAAGTVRDDASAIAGTRTDGHSNTNKEKTFELGHVDFIKPRIEKQSATKDETAKTETIIINVIDKYIDTTKEITADEITIYADEEIVTGITKTFSKNTRTTPATEEDLRYETNGNITTTINGTSKVIGQQYKLVLSDFEQATNNSKKYKDWSGTISIDVAEGAAKDQISGTTANTNELTTLKGDFVDFITPYLTYQYLTTDIDRTGADADGKSFQMAFEVTDKYYESGKLSIDDLSIQMADGKHTYDLKNTPVTIALNSDEAITAPNVKMTNKTTGEVETVTSTTIGHRYVLTISNLEQLEIAEGNTTLDYSGIVTVSVDANKISDRAGNTNIAKTITSGVSIPDETGDGVVVDVVKPIWRRTTGGSLDLTTKTASLVVKGTDTYYASNSLTAGKIKVYAYTGTTPTDITSLVSPALSTATRLDESVTVDGVTSTRQYGVQYTITLTGIPIDKDQVKVVIPAGTLTDQSGNTNEEYETRLFTTLQSAAGETAATSAFLGNSSIQRQNIESVTFVSGIEGAANNKWDVSAAQDGSIWAWYTGSGPYQVYIGSDEFMCANQDSRYLFSYIGYASNSTATNVINGLEYLNIITATNMSYMFNYCGYQKMTSLNLGNNFDTTNVTNMAGMFQNCGQTKMTSINLGTQFYTSKVTDMSNMFNGCGQTELITFSLGSNFDTTKVTNMSGMFQNFAHKLGILNLGTQFYTSEVTDMSNMFNGCGQNAMTTLTLGTNFDTTKVTNMSQMFKDFAKSSTGMTSLDLGDSFYTTSVTDMTRMFNGCGQTAMVALDLGPAFTKIASANTDFATNCGASGIVIYAPESIYSNRTSFKLNKTGQ